MFYSSSVLARGLLLSLVTLVLLAGAAAYGIHRERMVGKGA
jgi:hypothetical protein